MTNKVLVMTGGENLEITGEQGKYWLCGERKVRKLNRGILRVEEAKAPAEEKPEAAPKPAKKPAAKKKKKAEE